MLSVFIVAGLLGPALFTNVSPFDQNLAKEFAPPEQGHPFGFAENGVDVFAQILWAAKYSIFISIGSVITAVLVGLTLGGLAGWFGGKIDFLVLRITELFDSFPGLLLVVALAALLGPDPKNVFLVLVINSWVSFAKLTRLLVLRLKGQDFVLAAKAMGLRNKTIFIKYLVPAMSAELGVLAAQAMGNALIVESSLSFLGLGYPPGTPSWGSMLNQAREVLLTAPHVILFPALSIFICVFSFQLIGDGLRLMNQQND